MNNPVFKMNSNKPMVICFHAKYAGSYHMMKPVFKDLMEEYQDQVHFVILGKGEEVELENRYQIDNYPTVLFLIKEVATERLSGLVNREELYSHTQNLISQFLGLQTNSNEG